MSKIHNFDVFDTPLVMLTVVVNEDGAVTEIWTRDAGDILSKRAGYRRDRGAIAGVRRQLQEYVLGKRTQFELPLAPIGTPFQHQVWGLLMRIPYGQTRSYGQLAAQLGTPNASRAVGRANATNPIAIVVPCHRVIGSSGALTGYAGGLPVKQRLLELEGVLRPIFFGSDLPV